MKTRKLRNDVRLHESGEHLFHCNENRLHARSDEEFLQQLESEMQ